MGVEALMAAVGMAATAMGGWATGKRAAKSEALTEVTSLKDTLKEQLDLLKEENALKELRIIDLEERMNFVQEMVTQRAAVDDLIVEVQRIDGRVEKIAEHLGA